jgi:predicted dienelactone hydrolase
MGFIEAFARGALVAVLVGIVLRGGIGAVGAQATDLGAGLLELSLTDPVEGGKMPAVIAFPTTGRGAPTEVGPFVVDAVRGALPAAGKFPLVVFSHGTGGSSLGHHDSLTALARAGFVAAAVEHPRDNYRDDSGFGTDLQLQGRPHHVVALIDAILAHSTIGPAIDGQAGVGMVGHSAGGYTALLIAGAVPDFSLREAYERAIPDEQYQRRAATVRQRTRKPDLKAVADQRVRAILLMAPAIGYAFDKAALANVKIPVLLYRPTQDELLPHPWHAERIAQGLPTPPEYRSLHGAGHFVFLAPCSPALAARAPVICADPPGIDRKAIHAQLNVDMVAYFRKTLGPR